MQRSISCTDIEKKWKHTHTADRRLLFCLQQSTCLISFFQLVRMTVFLSISSFSMNELPRWCSSICTKQGRRFCETTVV